ncbi:hypothetical protein GCK72_017591 [Caenorhabditis remanei]|uniref:Uncharacterized protein n=1 Tax=Caenorhabditis remanei TaxID=31234 RepID=A0A6A5G936_CAERE|nr:hypothetical protein GCK72_017591 [Caenorhabditis remanei]KAF1751039.1 hypothetical protein GCK72_017591 [Caenorhabditis remanei]
MGSDISENEAEESDENDVDNWEEKTEKMEPDERRNTWERLEFFDLEKKQKNILIFDSSENEIMLTREEWNENEEEEAKVGVARREGGGERAASPRQVLVLFESTGHAVVGKKWRSC